MLIGSKYPFAAPVRQARTKTVQSAPILDSVRYQRYH
jgi:hypothetical protein